MHYKKGKTMYRVWIEIEEETEDGWHIDHSFGIDGAAVAEFDTLAEAVTFANKLQQIGEEGV